MPDDTMSEQEREMAALPSAAKKWIQKQSSDGIDLTYKNEPYFSRVRFEPDVLTADGSLNTTTTFNQGNQVQPFSYGIGGPMVSAGYRNTGTGFTQATAADTNLITAQGKQTNGDLVVIKGMSIAVSPASDPVLTKKLLPELSVSIGFNGNLNDFKLGKVLAWPGGMGLFGGASSILQQPANLQDNLGIVPGAFSNGLPGAADVRWFADQIIWMPTGGDSVLGMQIKCERAVTHVTTARVAATGVQAVVPPTTQGAVGTFVEFEVYFWGLQFGPRSRNR